MKCAICGHGVSCTQQKSEGNTIWRSYYCKWCGDVFITKEIVATSSNICKHSNAITKYSPSVTS